MKQLQFDDYEKFANAISDKYESMDDEYGDIAVIAKYEDANEIIRELLQSGYDIASVELNMERYEGYLDEYIIILNYDGIWCEKFKKDGKYLTDESSAIYVLDNCSSNVIRNLYSDEMYEVSIDSNNTDKTCGYDECESCKKCYDDDFYSINGKQVDKNTYNKYVSQFAPELVRNDKDVSSDCDYSVSAKCSLDAYEALKIIADMERKISHINDMFREADYFRRLFNW